MESADQLLQPPSCDAELSSKPIEKLPESLLAKVFSYLPFADRYQLCLVSSKWFAASRIPWTDVTFLNLNTIPPAMVCPILDLCPNIETIDATDLTILLQKKDGSARVVNEHVRTMTLRNVKLALTDLACGDAEPSDRDLFPVVFYHFLRFPKLSELILHNVSFATTTPRKEDGKSSTRNVSEFGIIGLLALPEELVACLRRFVVIDSATSIGAWHCINAVVERMENLQCLYVQGAPKALLPGSSDLPQLRDLRELCVVGGGYAFKQLAEMVAGSKLPKLEVFICASDTCVDPASLSLLITAKLPLRILVIAGRDAMFEAQGRAMDLLQQGVAVDWANIPSVELPVTLPPRQRLADSNAANNRSRAPPLQIFVGGDFTKYVRFTLPRSDVARFWRIDCPMPKFLAKPEVAEIFKDVFAAKIIREGPENGLLPWGHRDKMDLFFSADPLLFA